MATPTDQKHTPDGVPAPLGGVVQRIVSAPLWLHTVALAIVLLIVLAVTVPGYAYFSDEGAAIIQERQLRAGEGWVYDYPFATEDPTGEVRPFINGEESADGVAPYAKHPLFVAVLGVADGAFGVTGLVLVAVAGSVMAALGAGLIGRRIDPRLGVLALWVTGVASPLFFDAYLVLAHTIAAATAAFAVLLALTIVERKAPPAWMFVLLAIATAATVLLRSEGLAVVPGIVLGGVVVARFDPERRARALQVAVVAGLAGAVGFAGERAFIASILGDASEGSQIPTKNWLLGRFNGLLRTWFPATYTYQTTVDYLSALVPVIVALAAVRTRRTMTGGPLLAGFSVVAALLVLRLLLAGQGPIPGLAVAFPIGWAGLWLLRRRYFTAPAMRFVGMVGLVMVVAVLLTQYSRGAGVEWGGRYFAVALPIITPVLLRPFLDVKWDVGVSRRALPIAVIAVTAALMAIGVQTLRLTHTAHRGGVTTIADAADASARASGEQAVVVMTSRLGPQIVWNIFRDYDFLSPARDNVSRAREVLEENGRSQAVIFDTTGPGEPDWPNWIVVDSARVKYSYPVYSLIRR
jgi:hypothetical protein